MTQTIFKNIEAVPYAQVSRYLAEDDQLSWRAKGIMLYLLSRPTDWKVYVSELVDRSTDGRDATRSGIKELLAAGYILRFPLQDLDTGRLLGWTYEVYQYRLAEPDRRETSHTGNPSDGKTVSTKKEETKKEETKKHIDKYRNQVALSEFEQISNFTESEIESIEKWISFRVQQYKCKKTHQAVAVLLNHLVIAKENGYDIVKMINYFMAYTTYQNINAANIALALKNKKAGEQNAS